MGVFASEVMGCAKKVTKELRWSPYSSEQFYDFHSDQRLLELDVLHNFVCHINFCNTFNFSIFAIQQLRS